MSKRDNERAKRRLLKRYMAEVEPITDGDAAFFVEHPGRSHRIRRMSHPELMARSIVLGVGTIPSRPCNRFFVLVRQVHRGARLRLFVELPAVSDRGMSEDDIKSLFDEMSPPDGPTAQFQGRIQAAVRSQGLGSEARH